MVIWGLVVEVRWGYRWGRVGIRGESEVGDEDEGEDVDGDGDGAEVAQ